MTRKLIPPSWRDRANAGNALVSAFFFLVTIRTEQYWLSLLFVTTCLLSIYSAYVIQDLPSNTGGAGEYSAVIDRIGMIGVQLSELSAFLERERGRIVETEATVRKLHDEKARLEPIISIQRTTVDAILAAHTERTSKNAWKERLLGFVLGIGASLVASLFYDYFAR